MPEPDNVVTYRRIMKKIRTAKEDIARMICSRGDAAFRVGKTFFRTREDAEKFQTVDAELAAARLERRMFVETTTNPSAILWICTHWRHIYVVQEDIIPMLNRLQTQDLSLFMANDKLEKGLKDVCEKIIRERQQAGAAPAAGGTASV